MKGATKLGNRVTLADVAAAAEVAVGTVSRVLNENPTVAAPIRARVLATIARLGYRPDPNASSLRGGTTRLVACAIRDFDIPGFAPFIREAERVLREGGYTLLLCSTTNRPEVECGLLRDLAARRVDGLMTTLSDESDPALGEALAAAPMPLLLIDRDRPAAFDRVFVDHAAGTRDAVRHLAGLGRSRIALLTGDPRAHPARARLAGFREGLAAAGLPEHSGFVRQNVLLREDAFRETAHLLALPDAPDGLIVGAMDMLADTLRATRAAGHRLGRDLSVVAGSDSDLAELHEPPISAVDWDLAGMGRHAAAMLLDRLRGREAGPARPLRLPAGLVVRR